MERTAEIEAGFVHKLHLPSDENQLTALPFCPEWSSIGATCSTTSSDDGVGDLLILLVMPQGSSGHLTCRVYRVYRISDFRSAEAGVCRDGAQHRLMLVLISLPKLPNVADHCAVQLPKVCGDTGCGKSTQVRQLWGTSSGFHLQHENPGADETRVNECVVISRLAS